MDLQDLKFIINKDGKLKEKENAFLLEAYRNLFIKMYGLDIVDAYLNVTHENINEFMKNHPKVKHNAKNYEEAKNVLLSIKNTANLELILIYLNNKLIGGGRIKKVNNEDASILDLVICCNTLEIEREIWKRCVSFVEEYLVNKKYKKMYLYIPYKEGPLLYRADDLGFKENPDDINIDEEVFTYLLYKDLERK